MWRWEWQTHHTSCSIWFIFPSSAFALTPPPTPTHTHTVSPLWVAWEFLCRCLAAGRGRKMNWVRIVGACPLCKWCLSRAISAELSPWLMLGAWEHSGLRACHAHPSQITWLLTFPHCGSGKGGFRTLLGWSVSDFNDSSLWNRSNKDVGEKEGKQTLSQRYQSV